MRIAINAQVLGQWGRCGEFTYTYNLLRWLARVDRKNEYVLFSNTPIQSKITADNFREKLILSRNFWNFWSYLRVPLEFCFDSYDLFFAPIHSLPFFARPKSVITIHHLALPPKDLSSRFTVMLTEKYFTKAADRIITVSQATKNEILEKCNVSPQKINVIYSGYDQELYKEEMDEDKIFRVKEKYGINGEYIINPTGMLRLRKNPFRLIRAFHIFKSEGSNEVKLVITGTKGAIWREIQQLVFSLGLEKDVIFTDHVKIEEMPLLFSGANALIFPSLHEGFGLPLVEAMACGCPVITSNCSAMPEVIGDAGLLVNPYDEEEIAHAMKRVLSDSELRQSMHKRGLDRVEMFSWEKAAQKTLKVLESLG